MRKKYLFLVILILIMFLSFKYSSAEIIANDIEVFDARLTGVLVENISEQKWNLAADQLNKFSSEYPNSDFANDAQMMYNLLLFIKASAEGKKDLALSFINKVEAIANEYSEGKFNDFTCRRYNDILKNSSGIVFIPYKYLPTYMQGALAIDSKPRDLQAVIDNFSLLKDSIDFSKDTNGMLAREIYTSLLIAYRSLGNTEQVNSLVKEVSEKFPNNIPLLQTFKKLTSK